MAAACLAPSADLGLVRGLLGQVDCNLQSLVTGGYGALASPNSGMAAVLTSLLTLYVAFIGYQLLLGRTPLRVGDVTLSAIKLGAVLMLATQWSAYQVVVYDFLFRGPQQLAGLLLHTVQPVGSVFRGDPFAGLQVAYDQLQASASVFAAHAGPTAQTFQGGAGFGAFALNTASVVLLAVTLGALLGAKIVLALLLATGPVFLALFLFDATRGVFEGWARAAIGFALVPLMVTLLLALQLTLLELPLVALARMRARGITETGPAMAVLVLSLVYAAVFLFAGVAAVMIGAGLKLPRRSVVAVTEGRRAESPAAPTPWPAMAQTRAASVAAAVLRQDRWVERLSRESVRTDRAVTLTERWGDPAVARAAGSRRAFGPSGMASASRRDG